jgi:hypothetical protein
MCNTHLTAVPPSTPGASWALHVWRRSPGVGYSRWQCENDRCLRGRLSASCERMLRRSLLSVTFFASKIRRGRGSGIARRCKENTGDQRPQDKAHVRPLSYNQCPPIDGWPRSSTFWSRPRCCITSNGSRVDPRSKLSNRRRVLRGQTTGLDKASRSQMRVAKLVFG